ncbi:hypothetical protein [Hyphobacterium sp.]|uniref:hypothetical protein n=1 Tax=Hyphobacterium sp. TaxID=2004662 RepID=UPI003747F1D1
MKYALISAFLWVPVFGLPTSSEQSMRTYELVSHCDFYQYRRSLSDMLRAGDDAFLVRQSSREVSAALGSVGFDVIETYFGETRGEIDILRANPSDPAAAIEFTYSRYDAHVSPSFFWNYASRPNTYGYSGRSSSDCNLIPVTLPDQDYIVIMEDGKFTVFEPVPEGESPLKRWLEYYSEEIRGTVRGAWSD